MRKAITGVDLFSLPFQFAVGKDNDKAKRTLLGGIISLLIILLSVAYFAYLIYQYIENKIQPSIAGMDIFTRQKFEFPIGYDFMMIQVDLDDGTPLTQLQKTDGKIYMHTYVKYSYKNANNEDRAIQTLAKPCTIETFEDFFCFSMKEEDDDEGINLKFDPEGFLSTEIELNFGWCKPEFLEAGEVCETDLTVVQSKLLLMTTNVSLLINLEQFNVETKEFEYRRKQETFMFDQALAFTTQISLIKTDFKIIDGFIVQWIDEQSILTEYSRIDQSLSQVSIQAVEGTILFGQVKIQLRENNKKVSIQYPPFTQLLAMFSSVFNSLLAVGIICKILAETEMGQDLISVHLKVYYKKTAAKLLQRVGSSNTYSDKPASNPQDGSAQIGLYEDIQKLDFADEVQKKSKFSCLKRSLFFLSPPTAEDGKKNKDPLEAQLYARLNEASNQSMDIFSISRDLLEMKMMLKMLITPEQWAAMQLCGSSIQLDSDSQQQQNVQQAQQQQQQQPQVNTNLNTDLEALRSNPKESETARIVEMTSMRQQQDNSPKNLNHLEIIDRMETDYSLFKENFQRYLTTTSANPPTELDRRIHNCLIQTQDASGVQQRNIS